MKERIKYIENIIENWLDKFFLSYSVLWDRNSEVEVKKLIVEMKDVFLILRYGSFEFFIFSLKRLMDKEIIKEILHKGTEVLSMIFFMVTDIFGVLYILFINHIMLAKKIFKDYVHDEYRREVLGFLMLISLILLGISLLLVI
jgi:hypothetical protein